MARFGGEEGWEREDAACENRMSSCRSAGGARGVPLIFLNRSGMWSSSNGSRPQSIT